MRCSASLSNSNVNATSACDSNVGKGSPAAMITYHYRVGGSLWELLSSRRARHSGHGWRTATIGRRAAGRLQQKGFEARRCHVSGNFGRGALLWMDRRDPKECGPTFIHNSVHTSQTWRDLERSESQAGGGTGRARANGSGGVDRVRARGTGAGAAILVRNPERELAPEYQNLFRANGPATSSFVNRRRPISEWLNSG